MWIQGTGGKSARERGGVEAQQGALHGQGGTAAEDLGSSQVPGQPHPPSVPSWKVRVVGGGRLVVLPRRRLLGVRRFVREIAECGRYGFESGERWPTVEWVAMVTGGGMYSTSCMAVVV